MRRLLRACLVLGLLVCASAHAFCYNEAAARQHVDARLLQAMTKVESSFNPRAVNVNKNGSRDVGLMQINSQHFPILKAHGVTEDMLYDPCTNVQVGAWIFSKMVGMYGETWRAVGAYNAGIANGKESARAAYVAKVAHAYNQLLLQPPQK